MQVAGIGENTDLVCIEARYHVNVLRLDGLSVAVVCGLVQQLAVAEPVHDEHHLRDGHGCLIVNSSFPSSMSVRRGVANSSFDGLQVLLDHDVHIGPALQNMLVLGDLRHRLLILLLQGQNLQTDQLI